MLKAKKDEIILEIQHKETFEDKDVEETYKDKFLQADHKSADSESNSAEQIHQRP